MFGLLGVFLAVPAAALVQIVIDEFYLQPRKLDYAALDREAAALVEGKEVTTVVGHPLRSTKAMARHRQPVCLEIFEKISFSANLLREVTDLVRAF